MAEIPLDRHMLFFFFTMKNWTVPEKTGVGIFCADKFGFALFYKAMKQETAVFVADTSQHETIITEKNWIGYWQLFYTVGECQVSWTWFG